MRDKDSKLLQEAYDQVKEPYTEEAQNIFKLDQELKKLGTVPNEVGDPEWGYSTQEQHDQWRQQAERYAEEFELEFEGNKSVKEVDDQELAFAISNSGEQRIEAIIYRFKEEYGFSSFEDAWTAIENSVNQG